MEKDKYLLLTNLGLEGTNVKRYPTREALSDGIRNGENYGSPFIIAEELELIIITKKGKSDENKS